MGTWGAVGPDQVMHQSFVITAPPTYGEQQGLEALHCGDLLRGVTRKTGKHLMTGKRRKMPKNAGKHLKSAGKHYKKLVFVLFYNINNYLKDIK